MTVDPGDRLQAASGTLASTTALTVTLPAPTSDGTTLLLYAVTNGGVITPQAQSFDPPFFADGVAGGAYYRWRRDSQPAGETSWAITGSVAGPWIWRVEEWSGLATIGQPDAAGAVRIITTAQVNDTGGTAGGSFAVTDVDDYAALAMFRVLSGGTNLWPAGRSYTATGVTSGWTETDQLQTGDGTTGGDLMMLVAEAYPGAAGNVGCELTWDTTGGGSFATLTVHAQALCFQPDMAAPATGVLAAP